MYAGDIKKPQYIVEAFFVLIINFLIVVVHALERFLNLLLK